MAAGMTEQPLQLVTPARAKPAGNGNGFDGGLGQRLARVENQLEHVALKTDVLNLKLWILGGVIGGMAIAAGLALGIARLFMSAP